MHWYIGLFFVAIGAVTSADPSSDGVCVTSEWSILIGYTLELAPILIKVQAINKVTREAMRFRRLQIDQNKLKKYPLLFVTPVLIYLVIWTIVDMPKSTESLALDRSGSGNIVDVNKSCNSNYEIWVILAYVWQSLLLLSASVLAFQSRDVIEEMNESQWIAFLTYSHFMCLIFRIVIRGLSFSGAILGSVGSSIVSIVLSVDILAGLVIYFGPKFFNIATEKSSAKSMINNGLAGAASGSDFLEEGPDREKRGSATDLSVVARLRKAGVKVIRSESNVSRLSSLGYERSSCHDEEEKSEEKSPVMAFPVNVSNEHMQRSIKTVDTEIGTEKKASSDESLVESTGREARTTPNLEKALSADKDDEEKLTLLSSENKSEENKTNESIGVSSPTEKNDHNHSNDEEKLTLLSSKNESEENKNNETISVSSPTEKDEHNHSNGEEKVMLLSPKPSEENEKIESPSVSSLINKFENKSPADDILLPSLENNNDSEGNPKGSSEDHE